MTLFGNRTVYCMDAHEYLVHKSEIKAIITSPPDWDEIGNDFNKWLDFITHTCELIDSAISDDGIVVFYMTNRKMDGRIIDKKTIVANYFLNHGYNMIMSKIVLRRDVGNVDFFRPGFTNLFAFSRTAKTGRATPDVFHRGNMTYPNAMGDAACTEAIQFIRDRVDTDTIVDPFCGRGSVLRAANVYGFNAIGVDLDPDQCEHARNI